MFFCSWGIWWSFFSRWLTDPTHGLGMSSAEQGQIYSINSLATLVIMFVYGTIQDQLGIKRKLVIFISAVAACVGPFLQFVYQPIHRRASRLHRAVRGFHGRLLPVRSHHRTLLP